MKNRITLLLLTTSAAALLCLEGCKTDAGRSARGQLPKRSALEYDAYGGLISLQTIDSLFYEGELIGIRNDSVILLNKATGAHAVYHNDISTARVMVYDSDLNNTPFLMMIPNLLLLVHVPKFQAGPLALSIVTSAIDMIGITVAKKTEKKRINYYDQRDGWMEITKYSRFPNGVPSHLVLSDVKGRPSLANRKKCKDCDN